jgi:hypothetical protein
MFLAFGCEQIEKTIHLGHVGRAYRDPRSAIVSIR